MSIISEAKKGNAEAFVTLIEEYKLPMYKTAKAILKNEDDVCDAIQESLLSAYKNIESLKNEKYFKTWLIRITINKCYDIISKNITYDEKNEQMARNVEVGTDNYNVITEEKIDLQMVLNSLDNDLRLVTILYYYDDISVSEIADIMGIPAGTVKSKLNRARKKLYEMLTVRGGEDL